MGDQRIRASEWYVEPTDHAVAVDLIRLWHYAGGAPNTSVARHGMFPVGHVLGYPVGVALWLPPTRLAGEAVAGDDWRGVLSLSRLVVEPGVPKNAASFLLGRSMRLIDRERWPVLLTYADTRLGHTGAIYQATNWRCDGPVPAGDMWLDAEGRQAGRKRGRRNLSAQEMRERGYERAPAAPKIRFVHDVRGCHDVDR